MADGSGEREWVQSAEWQIWDCRTLGVITDGYGCCQSATLALHGCMFLLTIRRQGARIVALALWPAFGWLARVPKRFFDT